MNNRLTAMKLNHARSDAACGHDPLYLFACHAEWRRNRNFRMLQELLAALDDTDEETRFIAESLLSRPALEFATPDRNSIV